MYYRVSSASFAESNLANAIFPPSGTSLPLSMQAAKSRGRGIECFTELDKLLSYTESKQPQAVSQWVVQKYIEVWRGVIYVWCCGG